MGINEKQKIELFNDFYNWLKEDGLKPRKSERLHKKKIFAGLMANNQMTLDNFTDFLADRADRETKLLNTKSSIFEDIIFLKKLTANEIFKKKIDDFDKLINKDLLKATNLNLQELVNYARDFENYLLLKIEEAKKMKKRNRNEF